ncbi:hypothetical protein D3C86_762490 [compost metagenome]
MLLVGVHLRQVDLDVRLRQTRLGNHLGQELIHRAADKTDIDRTNVALGKTPCGDCRLLSALQQVLRFDEKRPACSGEGDAASTAGEQRDAEVMFQQLNLPTERRLGHVQPFGGAAKIQFSGDGGEAAQLSQLEH